MFNLKRAWKHYLDLPTNNAHQLISIVLTLLGGISSFVLSAIGVWSITSCDFDYFLSINILFFSQVPIYGILILRTKEARKGNKKTWESAHISSFILLFLLSIILAFVLTWEEFSH